MKNLFLAVMLLSGSLLFAESQNDSTNVITQEVNTKQIEVRESTILFKLKEDISPSELKRFNSLVNPSTIIEKRELKGLKVNIVKIKNIKGLEKSFSKKLLDTGAVKFAEPDALIPHSATPNDSSYGSQWHHNTINSALAWDKSTGSSSVNVCVLDTGVDTDHPDLSTNLLLPGYNAFFKVIGSVEDEYGHGTGTSGLIGAVGNNGVGVSGMNWDVKIIPIQINRGSIDSNAYISDMAHGIEWCANRRDDLTDNIDAVKVANLSYGGVQYSTISEAGQYLRDRGGLLFMSAGNGGTYRSENAYPDYSSFVAVGASTSSDTKASFSDYGTYIDVFAPGVSTYTTKYNASYGSMSGTSFSSPITAGLAALIFSVNENFTPSEVENFIFNTTVDLGDVGEDDTFGHGRIDAGAAVLAAVNYAGPNTPPVAVATTNNNLIGTVPYNVLFDGSGSNDPDGAEGESLEYLWDFDDNGTSTDINPNHTFTQAGTYNVTLTVKDVNFGENTSSPITIEVQQSSNSVNTPTNLDGIVDEEENSVTLTWTHNLINVGSFEIFKAKKRRGKYNFPENPTFVCDVANTHVELNVDAGNYKYLIRAVSMDSTFVSEFSNEKLVVVQTGLPSDPPPALESPVLSIDNIGPIVVLSWNDTCSGCTYKVQRAVKAKGKASFNDLDSMYVVDNIGKTVTIIETAGSYTYRVSAIKDSDISDYSNNVSIRIK